MCDAEPVLKAARGTLRTIFSSLPERARRGEEAVTRYPYAAPARARLIARCRQCIMADIVAGWYAACSALKTADRNPTAGRLNALNLVALVMSRNARPTIVKAL